MVNLSINDIVMSSNDVKIIWSFVLAGSDLGALALFCASIHGIEELNECKRQEN